VLRDYSFTGTSRAEMIYNKQKLLSLGGVRQGLIREWKHKQAEAEAQEVFKPPVPQPATGKPAGSPPARPAPVRAASRARRRPSGTSTTRRE
jgi:hypothetical protein